MEVMGREGETVRMKWETEPRSGRDEAHMTDMKPPAKNIKDHI